VARALEHFDAAERLLPDAGDRFHQQRGRAQAGMYGVRTHLLAESGRRARGIAEHLGRRDLMVTADWALSWASFNQGHLREAEQLAEGAWHTAHDLADPFLGWVATQAPAVRANLYLLDPRSAREWCRRGLGQRRFATLAFGHDAVADQLAIALALQGDLEAVDDLVPDLPDDAVAHRVVALLSGQWEDAAAGFAEAGELDESRGDLNDAAHNHLWGAWALRLLGAVPAAVAALERAVSIAVVGPQVPTELAARAALARVLAGDDPAAAATHLHRCEAILAGGEEWHGLRGTVEVARAALAAATGDTEAAEAHRAHALATFGEQHLPWHRTDASTATDVTP
jgi:tetratricopeptide (TPR) repeat protein